jgi:hypothetical protein
VRPSRLEKLIAGAPLTGAKKQSSVNIAQQAEAIPPEWLEKKRKGKPRGPGPGEKPSEATRQLFESLVEMERLANPKRPIERLRPQPDSAPDQESQKRS